MSTFCIQHPTSQVPATTTPASIPLLLVRLVAVFRGRLSSYLRDYLVYVYENEHSPGIGLECALHMVEMQTKQYKHYSCVPCTVRVLPESKRPTSTVRRSKMMQQHVVPSKNCDIFVLQKTSEQFTRRTDRSSTDLGHLNPNPPVITKTERHKTKTCINYGTMHTSFR